MYYTLSLQYIAWSVRRWGSIVRCIIIIH